MLSRVAVVTDSTAYLPAGTAEKHDVSVVALQVVIDGRVGEEGRNVLPADVAAALRRHARVSTSRPSPETFAAAYQALADGGARAVVSMHLSGGLSGTVDNARLAAASAPIEVRVVDSHSAAMGLGFAVIAAAEAATADGGLEEVEQAAVEVSGRTSTLFYVDTLEYLRRGGRIGTAAALLGSALLVKPILDMAGGTITPLEKVRTTSKALARLVELAADRAGSGPVDLAVHHLAAPARAEHVAGELRARIPGLQSLHVSEVGAVIGAHVGPGLIGVVVRVR